MNKLFLILFAGCALFVTNADALRVQVNPSVTFRSSNQTCYPCAQRVIVAPPVMAVRPYVDPYTGYTYYYQTPVYQQYYYQPQHYHSHGTDFQLQFRFR